MDLCSLSGFPVRGEKDGDSAFSCALTVSRTEPRSRDQVLLGTRATSRQLLLRLRVCPQVYVSWAAVAAFALIGLPALTLATGFTGLVKFWLMPWLGELCSALCFCTAMYLLTFKGDREAGHSVGIDCFRCGHSAERPVA